MGAAAVEGGRLTFAYAAMLFLVSPLIGGLSDRFGRRPLLILAIASFALDNLICALAPSLAWLYLGRLLSGISGSTGPVIGAYVADTTAPDERAGRFGRVGMAFGAGFMLGPALGGLVGELSPRAPFLAAALLALVNACVGWAFLKESLPVERRRPLDIKRSNPFGALRFIAGVAGHRPADLGAGADAGGARLAARRLDLLAEGALRLGRTGDRPVADAGRRGDDGGDRSSSWGHR